MKQVSDKLKKIPAIIYVAAVVAVIAVILGIYLYSRYAVNHRFVEAYNQGQYNVDEEIGLLEHNFPEGYVPYYNLGNVAFKNGDYDAAIVYYVNALNENPTGEKDCSVRINLALALCYSIDFDDLDTQEKIDEALEILYYARDILLENGCAEDEPLIGHDEDAQQLKEDIDEMIRKLEQQESSDESQGDEQSQEENEQDQNNQSQSDEGSEAKEKKIQQELEQQKQQSIAERNDNQSELESYSQQYGGKDSDSEDGDYKPW